MTEVVSNIVDSLSTVLSEEKVYNISSICVKYGLGDGQGYSTPESKYKIYSRCISAEGQKVHH